MHYAIIVLVIVAALPVENRLNVAPLLFQASYLPWDEENDSDVVWLLTSKQ